MLNSTTVRSSASKLDKEKKVHGARINAFSKRVLDWFETAGRSFPWRRKGEPLYRLVVTEILLQRTRAETVARFYSTFFERYPDWPSLASAEIGDLESILQPIGMWRQRAPRLKALGTAIVERGGSLPSVMQELELLPAVGQYVANAALLFQGVKALPLLDAGMARVLERYFGERSLADIRYDRYLQDLSARIVAGEHAISLNWAVLDLAALICRRTKPQCNECPVNQRCRYHKLN